MKYSTITLASALQLAVSVLGQDDLPQCNPAIHCPSISIECIGCNPRTEDNCDPNDINTFGKGLCVEPAALDYTDKVYGMEYMERCRRVVDPSWADVRPYPIPEDYIHSCREGHYTCADGTCELAEDYPKECYKGIYNLVGTDRFDCNYADDLDIRKKLGNFWETVKTTHTNYCKGHGGVRYGPLRCNRNDIDVTISNNECEPGSEPKPPICQDEGSPITLFGPSDACTATCNDYSDLHDVPGCCIDLEKEQVCSDFVVYAPQEDVSRCDGDELKDGCDVCQQFVDEGYVYCCNDGKNPVCVNDQGLDAAGKPSECRKASDDSLKGDVCYVDSSGSTAKPPKISDTGFGTSGVELTFKFQQAEDLPPERDCCCDVVCSCFGDPHCTSFFGDYEVSQDEEGTYLMAREGDFEAVGHLARPLGVSGEFDFKLGDMTINVDADPCVYGEGITVNGEMVDDTSNIDGVEYYRTTDRPNNKDSKPYHRNRNLNEHLAINPSFVFIAYGDYSVEVKCLRFEISRGKDKGWWNRLDITIRRGVEDLETTPGCCPTNEQIYEELEKPGINVEGFCFRHPTEDGFWFENGQDLTNSGARRRLRAMDQAIVELEGRELKNMKHLAQRYADKTGMTYEKAVTLLEENGRAAVQNLLKNLEDNCKYYASDPVFDYNVNSQCEGGLVLYAKKPTQDTWTPIKFFPKHVNYCDDKVLVVYEHTKVGNKQLDNSYELKLTTCTPDPKTCGDLAARPCQPFGGIDNLGVSKYAYDSTLKDAMVELLTLASEECECLDKPVECILACMNTGSCPQSGTCTN